jgi:hypothetical protein
MSRRPRRIASPWIAYHEHSRAGAWPTREAAIEALDRAAPFNTGRASVFHKVTKETWSRRNGTWQRTDKNGVAPAPATDAKPELDPKSPPGAARCDDTASPWWAGLD